MAKILVIDDYQAIRNLYKASLETSGHQVTTAENAEQGLSYMLQGGYDLILLDLSMPKKGALWLLEQVKQYTPQLPNGHIIPVSAKPETDYQRQGKQQHPIGFQVL